MVDWTKTNMSGGFPNGVYQAPATSQGYNDPFKKPKPLTPTGPSYGADQNYGMGQPGYQMPLSQAQLNAQVSNHAAANGVDMSQSIYGKALAAKQQEQQRSIAGAPTQAPAAIANTGAGGLAGFLQDQADKREAEAQRLAGEIRSQVNPYGTNTEGYRVGVNGARNRLVGQQNNEQALAAGRLGGLASGLRGAQSQAMANDQRASMAGLEAQMYGAERDRATGYESDRQRALMQLANGDFSGASGIYGTLMAATMNQSNADRGYGIDMARLDLARGQDAREAISSDLDNQGKRLQINEAARQAVISGKISEAEVAAKMAQLAAIKSDAEQQAWMAQNSWWLGPLKAAVNIGAGVATAGINPLAGAGQAIEGIRGLLPLTRTNGYQADPGTGYQGGYA